MHASALALALPASGSAKDQTSHASVHTHRKIDDPNAASPAADVVCDEGPAGAPGSVGAGSVGAWPDVGAAGGGNATPAAGAGAFAGVGAAALGALLPPRRASHATISSGLAGRVSGAKLKVLTASVNVCIRNSLWALFFTMATARRFSKMNAKRAFPEPGLNITPTSISHTWIISRASLSLSSRGKGMRLSPRSSATAAPDPSSAPESWATSWSKMSSWIFALTFGMFATQITGTGHTLNAVSPRDVPSDKYFMRLRPVDCLGTAWYVNTT